MSSPISFFVPGIAKTAGSKRAFMRSGMEFPVIVDDCKTGNDWKADVKAFAVQAYSRPPMDGPISVTLEFVMTRPKAHFGSGRNANVLKASAPKAHSSKPDVLKMARAVEDALTGIIWRDDAQIWAERLSKTYGANPGVWITVMNQTTPNTNEHRARTPQNETPSFEL